MTHKRLRQILPLRAGSCLVGLGAGALLCVQAQEVTVNLDFNTDPSASGDITSINSSEPVSWRPDGGASGADGDGYLALTDSKTSQSTTIVFADLTPGFVTESFRFACDFRIGGGDANPADGFSVNFASAEDPLVVAADAGSRPTGPWNGTDAEPGPPGGGGLPEEGTTTGLAIGFDTWQSALINGVQDVQGISVRVNGQLVTQLPTPLRPGNLYPGGTYDADAFDNLATDDPNYLSSMQTGARNAQAITDAGLVVNNQVPWGDPDWGLWVENLVWERFEVEITPEAKVKVWWKGVELTPEGGLDTPFRQIQGRVVFGGRTGGNTQVHHVDNMTVTVRAATTFIIGAATGTPTGFTISTTDSGQSVVAENAPLTLTLNGTPVTPTSVTKAGGVLTITYNDPANPLPSGSTQEVGLTISDTNGEEKSGTSSFVVPTYISLPPEYAVSGANTPGFFLDLYHIDQPFDGTTQLAVPNSVQRAERQLHGDLGENIATEYDFPFGIIDSFVETTTINYSQDNGDFATVEAAGNYTEATGFPDRIIPGTPSTALAPDPNSPPSFHRDNLAIAINTVLHFPQQGYYDLIFNSDDGFRTTFWKNGREKIASTIVSQVDAGRGASDSVVTIYITEPGYYPCQTVYFEGGGGASLEWAASTMGGPRTLINSTQAGSIKAYQVATGGTPSAVTFADPVRDSGNPYDPAMPWTFEISNGTSAVDAGTIKVLVNGDEMTRNVSSITGGSRVTVNPPNGFWPGGTHEVRIQFAEQGGAMYDAAYNVTIRDWVAIPPSLALSSGAVTSQPRGFLVRTVQMDNGDGFGTSVYGANTVLAGLLGKPNIANMADFDADGWFRETTTINYEQGADDGAGNWAPVDAGNFNPNRLIPGIPGGSNTPKDNTDNFALEMLTVLHFPQAGMYWLGFNSDDGFATYAGNPKDRMAPILGIADVGRGATDTWYLVRITQPGYYPIRNIYFEGGGGASCEWFSLTPPTLLNNVTRTLLNDTGGIAAYQYPLQNAGAPYVKAYGPAIAGRGNNAPLTGTVNVWLEDGATPVGAVSMTYDGAAVTPTVNKDGTTTHVTYTPDALLAEGQTVPVQVMVGDRTLAWSFTTETGNPPTGDVVFFIEAEDFDNNGAGQPAASEMPYLGGAYAGLSAVFDTDYNRPNEPSSPLVRIGEDPQVPIERNNDRDRGIVEVQANFAIGWGAAGHWYQYTRDMPTGQYNVWAGISDGDANRTMEGTLDLVEGGTPTPLGIFNAASTGGWNNNDLVPLQDENGNIVTVNMGGTQTLRWSIAGGSASNLDFLLFTVPGEAPDQPMFTSVVLNQDGTVTVTWEGGGTLEVATEVTGPWTPEVGAASPYTFTPPAPILFGRIAK